MNANQRKFLIETIEKQYKVELEELNSREPKAPSLNNYLIAAILDGSFVMRPPELFREDIQQRVRDLGKHEALLDSRIEFGRRGNKNDEGALITLRADLLFASPPAYAAARSVYEEKYAVWEADLKALKVSMESMRIKINVGSDKALEALVQQADSLCALSLTKSSQLLIAQ